MAEGNATIAALRAASSAAPQGPSGPVALAYPWMTRQGAELVMPSRAPVARQSRPALPTAPTVVPAREFRKSTVPPEFRVGVAPGASPPRSSDGSFVTQNTPGFVDGVTLPREPAWNFNPTLLDDLMPRNPDAPVYTMPPQDVVPAEPEAPSATPPQYDVPVSSSQMAAEPSMPPTSLAEMLQQMVPAAPAETKAPAGAPPVVNADLGLLEYIQPVPYAEAAPEPAQAAAPVSDFDLAQLLQFSQPDAPAAPVQPPAPQQQAVDVTLDPELLGMLGIPRRVRGGVMR